MCNSHFGTQQFLCAIYMHIMSMLTGRVRSIVQRTVEDWLRGESRGDQLYWDTVIDAGQRVNGESRSSLAFNKKLKQLCAD